jgi:chorismate-pyruvate lyase
LLQHFYGKLGLPLPSLNEVQGEEMPQPYKGLLVHSSDMTPTLEAFYRQPMRLNVLTREQHDYAYLREVVLKSSSDARPVAYGVIRICLDHLPPPASLHVIEEQRPLGNILQREAIPHLSWPQAFFRVQSDSHLGHVLYLSQPASLYGRRNVLLDGSRRLLAEVIEILAPVP